MVITPTPLVGVGTDEIYGVGVVHMHHTFMDVHLSDDVRCVIDELCMLSHKLHMGIGQYIDEESIFYIWQRLEKQVYYTCHYTTYLGSP